MTRPTGLACSGSSAADTATDEREGDAGPDAPVAAAAAAAVRPDPDSGAAGDEGEGVDRLAA